MSSRQRSKKPEAAAPKKAHKEKPARPAGKAPEAVVETRHGTEMMSRPGRGFSLGELSGAGLAPRLASAWGASVDLRRRSVLQGNIDALKGWGARPAPQGKAEGKVKEVEEEIEKVAEEAKEEVKVAEEEVEKVGRKVKKEVAKAEKAAKAKAERKPKPKKKSET